MSDDNRSDENHKPKHDNPAIQRFKQRAQADAGEDEDRSTLSDSQANKSEPNKGSAGAESCDDDDSRGSEKDSTERSDATAAEQTVDQSSDESEAGHPAEPVFYDDPDIASNRQTGRSVPPLLRRVAKGMGVEINDRASLTDQLHAMANRGRSLMNGSQQDAAPAEDESESEEPIEAQSSRQARRRKKPGKKDRSKSKTRKARAVPREDDDSSAESDIPPPRKKKPARLLLAAGAVAALTVYATSQGMINPPVIGSLLSGHTDNHSDDALPSRSGLPTNAKATNQGPVKDNSKASNTDDLADASFGDIDSGSHGQDKTLPSLSGVHFKETPAGVQQKVASVIDAPEVTSKAGHTASDRASADNAIADPATANSQPHTMAEKSTGGSSTEGDTDSSSQSASDQKVASKSKSLVGKGGPESDKNSKGPTMPDAVSPQSEDQSAKAAASSSVAPQPSPAKSGLAKRLDQMEKQLKASQDQIAKLKAHKTPAKRRVVHQASYAKPDLQIEAISIARYCNDCLPLVTARYHGKQVHLSDGDTFHGFVVDIQGDRMLLRHGERQFSYYPGS